MKLTKTLLAVTLATAAMSAQAALVDRGGGLIYDTDLNVSWLKDANYAKTSGYDADGMMNWADANAWAINLSFYDSVRNVTYDDWRLPSINPINGVSFVYSWSADGSTDGSGTSGSSYNISEQGTIYANSTASEMAYLFYNGLNNKSFCPVSTGCSPYPQAGWGLVTTSPFINLQPDRYWSSTEYADPNGTVGVYGWTFNFNAGDQGGEGKEWPCCYALAVRPGDVAAVPEPETYAMMLAGLGLIGGIARRRKQQQASA